MNPILKNVLAVAAGIIIGGIINGGLIMLGPSIIPLPEGIDPGNIESIKANIHRYSTANFISVFLAHALGTLVGAFVCTKLLAVRQITFPILIGFFFLIGGVSMVKQIGGPTWFTSLDLILAYVPMAWLGAKLGGIDKI